jgi:hypothetical protein
MGLAADGTGETIVGVVGVRELREGSARLIRTTVCRAARKSTPPFCQSNARTRPVSATSSCNRRSFGGNPGHGEDRA